MDVIDLKVSRSWAVESLVCTLFSLRSQGLTTVYNVQLGVRRRLFLHIGRYRYLQLSTQISSSVPQAPAPAGANARANTRTHRQPSVRDSSVNTNRSVRSFHVRPFWNVRCPGKGFCGVWVGRSRSRLGVGGRKKPSDLRAGTRPSRASPDGWVVAMNSRAHGKTIMVCSEQLRSGVVQ